MQTLGITMDPIESINPLKDSTFALMLEAQRRNYKLYYFQPKDIFLEADRVLAVMQEIRVADHKDNYYEIINTITAPLSDCHIILMRKDPPVDMAYIYTTMLLELAEKQGVRVINKPQALRDVNEKLFISWFPQCCVPTLVTSMAAQLKSFLARYQDIILKPLDGMGGKGIFRLTTADPNLNAIIETLTQQDSVRVMAQQYIPDITAGDKRVIMIHGEAVPYAVSRIAASGETRANLATGGQAVPSTLTERDRWICAQVSPVLKAKGLALVGLDIIGDYLTEINVTSPTCLRHIDKFYNINTSAYFFDGL